MYRSFIFVQKETVVINAVTDAMQSVSIAYLIESLAMNTQSLKILLVVYVHSLTIPTAKLTIPMAECIQIQSQR